MDPQPPALRFDTDKVAQGYLPTYLWLASELGSAARVCEIGVWHGGSLQMWQALFPDGLICGVDNDESMRWPTGTVQVISDQADPKLPARLQALAYPEDWDLIVDDASHHGQTTRATFDLLWPLVRPGGFYVIEDWFVGFGHHPQFRDDGSMLTVAQSFLSMLAQPPDEPAQFGGITWQVDSVTYRYGLIVVRKA